MATREKKRINIRGLLNRLPEGNDPVYLPRADYRVSVVRAVASALTQDTGKKFHVTTPGKYIAITRVS